MLQAWILVGILALLVVSGIVIEAKHNHLKHQAEIDRRKHKYGQYHL